MIWVLLAAAVGAALLAAWGFSPFHARARELVRARRALRREVDLTRGVLGGRERGLLDAARHHARGLAARRLREIPVERLRDLTGGGARLAALAEAGYRTVADLHGVPAYRLVAVRGVGPRTAAAVAKAVKEAARTAEEEPPALPGPDLGASGEVDLARAVLLYLDAKERLGELADRLEEDVAELPPPPRSGLVAWLLGPRDPAPLAAWTARARALLDTEAFDEAAARRAALAEEGRTPWEAGAVRARFAASYADACALIESAFGRIGERAAREAGRGLFRRRRPEAAAAAGIPDAPSTREVVARVEAFPLDASGLGVTLRRYQEFGARFLLAQERTILGDEMGLGKTIEALAVMAHLWKEEAGRRFLVVAPASILANWTHEAAARARFPCRMLHGDDFAEDVRAWERDRGLGVVSYATLRRRIGAMPESLDLLVADEAHYAKNPEAARTRALADLAGRARRVAFLTGTPMENHPDEFVALLRTLAPAQVGDVDGFADRAARALGRPRAFHLRVAGVYLRRNQEDVLRELPSRLEKEEWVELGDAEREEYGRRVFRGDFMGMRQAVTGGAKLARLLDLLAEHRAEERKVLVFSYFLGVLARVGEAVPHVGRVTGALGPEERFALVQRFQEASGHQVLLLQVQAGGHGLNLQAASAVVFMEPQVKPTMEAQAIARAHRMGQTRRVLVHRLLAAESVDARMVEMLAKKRSLFDLFARKSLVKEASEEAVGTGLARAIVEQEQERLRGAR